MNEVTDGIKQAPLRRFRPYREYRDSGVEWLGEIPDHWAVKRLTDLANLVNGFPFDSKSFDRSQGTPLVRIRDLFNTTTEVKWSGAPVPQAEIGNGDILIGMDGDFSVGWWAHGPALLNQRLCSVRALEVRLSQRYLFYSLPFPLSALNDVTYATTVKHVSSLEILKFRLPCPPLDEQRAIAIFLDRETAKIDALMARKERLIELLQEKRIALITGAVTRGLDPNVPMKDSGVEWLGEIPAHWEVTPLKHLLSRCDYGISESLGGDGDIRVLTMAHIQNGEVILPDDGSINGVDRSMMLDLGDLLFNRTNSRELVGKVGLFRGELGDQVTFASYLVRLTTREGVDPEWLNYLLNSTGVLGMARSMALLSVNQANLNPTKYQQIVVPVPTLSEQQSIARFVRCETGRINALSAKIQQAIDHLREFRTALISAAVTGKIDVREAASR